MTRLRSEEPHRARNDNNRHQRGEYQQAPPIDERDAGRQALEGRALGTNPRLLFGRGIGEARAVSGGAGSSIKPGMSSSAAVGKSSKSGVGVSGSAERTSRPDGDAEGAVGPTRAGCGTTN